MCDSSIFAKVSPIWPRIGNSVDFLHPTQINIELIENCSTDGTTSHYFKFGLKQIVFP